VVLRQLEYLSALAAERHFGRAAVACHVSQPALSAAIRRLEAELGVELVHRTRRFDELTPQGEQLLRWARQTLSAADGLSSEAARLAGELAGPLRLGVIPTALPVVAEIAQPLLIENPGIDLEVRSLSSVEIAAQLDSFAIDAGITYLDNEPLGRLMPTPIYTERYVFLTAEEGGEESIPWSGLDQVSLCLLSPDMQNRRIIDAALRGSRARAQARIETSSISALLAFTRAGWSSVVCESWLNLYGVPEGMRALPLVEPELAYTIGLVTRKTELPTPSVKALMQSIADR
jgi:DNA-binding transcriptional LysR family regulator